MSRHVFSRFSFLPLAALVIALGCGHAPPALAQSAIATHEEMKSQAALAQESSMLTRENFFGLQRAFDAAIETVKNALIEQDRQRRADVANVAPIRGIMKSAAALPVSSAFDSQIRADLAKSSQNFFNRVPIAKNAPRAPYIVDSSKPSSVSAALFDIFMRFFCNPESMSGELKGKTFEIKSVDYGGKTMSYNVGCGHADNASVATRETVLGKDKAHEGIEAEQLIDLPVRVEDLFFSDTTFPVQPSDGKDPMASSATNVNRAADVIFGAYMMALRFLLGEPPPANTMTNLATDKSAAIETKAKIARQALAAMPFNELFAAKIGTMSNNANGTSVVGVLADMLQANMGKATEDPLILARLQNLRKRQNISQAEYWSILMEMLASPGYLDRLQNLNETQLSREMLWLQGLNIALNYQQNHWLEMDAALTAVNSR